ncbi:sterol transporter outer membrane protein BstC [Methylomagnum sp.]
MRSLPILSAALALVALSGCAKLHRGMVSFGALSGCPEETAATLATRQNELGSHSDTPALQCALDFLRNTHDPAVLRTPLGSRVCLRLAERQSNAETREKLAAEGVRFADEALALGASDKGAVHYYLAANLGLAVRDQPTLAQQNLPRLENEMRHAVELSQDTDDGGPLRLLGMLYLKAPPWPVGIGDGDKALDLLKQAVDKHPAHPLNHLFYAQALWEVEGDSAAHQAKTELASGMKLLKDGDWGYSKEPWLKEFAEAEKEIGEVSAAGISGAGVAVR